MSQDSSKAKTATLHVCRFCGRVGVGTQPSMIDFGGCIPPNKAHIFQQVEVVVQS